jgi:hypothetical protein
MSMTNRRPLARSLPGDIVLDEHHDGHGNRKMTATPTAGGVIIAISHSDGRVFSAIVPCRCAA